MANIEQLNPEQLGYAVLKAFEVGKLMNVQKISTALKDNVSRERVGLEEQFVFDLFTKNIDDIEKKWE